MIANISHTEIRKSKRYAFNVTQNHIPINYALLLQRLDPTRYDAVQLNFHRAVFMNRMS